MERFLVVDDVIAAQTPNIETPFRTILPEFDQIIEIGFYSGGLSLWLFKNKRPATRLVSYDITLDYKQVHNEQMDFRQGDCFDDSICEEIKAAVRHSNRTLVLCDGGHKEREFDLFSTFLCSGDVIMCHDYSDDDEHFETLKLELNWATMPESRFANIKGAVERNSLTGYYYEDFRNVLWGSFMKR